MPGNLPLKAGTLVVLQDNTSTSVAVGAAAKAAAVLDNTTIGAETVVFGLTAGFGSAPTIAPGGPLISLYAVPRVDGTNPATVDLTTPVLPGICYVGGFQVIEATTTPQRMVSPTFPLDALVYDIYIADLAGQIISSGWVLDAAPTGGSYT